MRFRGRRVAFAGAFALAVVLAPLVHIRPFADGGERFSGHADQAAMANAARNLAEGRGAVIDAVWLLRNGGIPGDEVTHPDEYWSLYVAAVVAPFFRLLGATREVVVLVAWLHCLVIAGLAAYWTYRFSGSALGALTIALLLLYHPMMTDRLNGLFDVYLTCYLLGSGSLFILAIERSSRRLFLVAGLLAGVAAGVKVSGLFIVGCGLAYFLLGPHSWAKLRRGFPYWIGVVAGVAPLVAFNQSNFGSVTQPGLRLVREGLITRHLLGHDRAYYDPELAIHSPEEIREARLQMAKSRTVRFARETVSGGIVPWLVLLPLAWYLIATFVTNQRAPPPWGSAEGLFLLGTALLAGGGCALGPVVEFEARYWNFLVPPLAVLAAVGVARSGRPLLLLAVPYAIWLARERWESFTLSPAPSAYGVVRELVPWDAVVLTSNPWEHAFHTRRKSVALPYSHKVHVLREVAERYRAEYIVIIDRDARHPAFDALENGRFPPWIERVHFSRHLVIGRLRWPAARS